MMRNAPGSPSSAAGSAGRRGPSAARPSQPAALPRAPRSCVCASEGGVSTGVGPRGARVGEREGERGTHGLALGCAPPIVLAMLPIMWCCMSRLGTGRPSAVSASREEEGVDRNTTHSSTSRTLVPLPRAMVMTRLVRPIGSPFFPRRTCASNGQAEVSLVSSQSLQPADRGI